MPRYQTDPLDSGPPPVIEDDDGKPKPIGVPRDYEAAVIQNRSYSYDDEGRLNTSVPGLHEGRQKPTYFDGDDWVPAGHSASDIFEMQVALAKVGLLRGNWSGGYWDTPTREAYRELLGMANAAGVTNADQLLNQMLAQTSDLGGSGLFTVDENGNVVQIRDEAATRPPLVTRTTDPAALKSVFRRSIIELLGEGWDEERLNGMVQAYNDMEVQRQTDMYNMELTGGNVVDIPSPEAFVESRAREQDPVGAMSQDFLDTADQFMQFATAPAWGVSAQ